MNNFSLQCPPILQTGFRVFFMGAAVYAVVSMIFWNLFYVMGRGVFVPMSLTLWHGHEMVFGFALAVVAGFLLTAVMNWTGLPTLSGKLLLGLFSLWAAGRILAFMPHPFPLWPLVSCNVLFLAFLSVALIRPIIAAKQWKQAAVISKLILLLITVTFLYVGFFYADLNVQRKALRFAVYIIIGLIFTIGRRIIPFFTQSGVGYPVTLRNCKILDISSLIFLLAFAVLDTFYPQPAVITALCAGLVIIHTVRLGGWYTHGIWKKPLLWILFVGYGFLIMGFVLKIYATLGQRPDDGAIHAFTAGGIGLFTLGMMARVAWGHTGRNIAQPPRLLIFIFAAIVISALIRTFFPLFVPAQYILWITLSQAFWITAFGLYLVVYGPILIAPRPDGKWG